MPAATGDQIRAEVKMDGGLRLLLPSPRLTYRPVRLGRSPGTMGAVALTGVHPVSVAT
jgi:hypothetical protein